MRPGKSKFGAIEPSKTTRVSYDVSLSVTILWVIQLNKDINKYTKLQFVGMFWSHKHLCKHITRCVKMLSLWTITVLQFYLCIMDCVLAQGHFRQGMLNIILKDVLRTIYMTEHFRVIYVTPVPISMQITCHSHLVYMSHHSFVLIYKWYGHMLSLQTKLSLLVLFKCLYISIPFISVGKTSMALITWLCMVLILDIS